MRDLILLRGVPASGKSTWIEKMGLQNYTVSSDQVRMLFSSPAIDWKDGKPSISQKEDRLVWETIHQMIETRMKHGDLIFMDAVNVRVSDWKKLAEKYHYRIWVKSFDVTLEECIARDLFRGYKSVGEETISKFYQKLKNTPIPSYAKKFEEEKFFSYEPLDCNRWKKIYIFGDIHGCYTPLESFFKKNPISKDNLYIFLGDYLDRGDRNLETISFLFSVKNEENFLFLEGNHSWERLWAEGRMEEIKSSEFLQNTLPQIQSISKAELLDFCSKWKEYLLLSFAGKEFFLSHAGFGYFPEELRLISSRNFIRGGDYEEDVDSVWEEKFRKIYQIHGHRNFYEYSVDRFQTSFNLCSAVEFGDDLRIMEIDTDGSFHFHFEENPAGKGKKNPWKEERSGHSHFEKTQTEADLFQKLNFSEEILKKDLGDGLVSFNFKRKVFYSGKWSKYTEVARGLFMDSNSKKIVARSYRKFFNFQEENRNSLSFLKKNLVFPVVAYQKYNGFLGIISSRNGELCFFSKTTNHGDYAEKLKEIFQDSFSWETQKEILDFLERNHSTMVVEVIDPEFDPHIIKYDLPHLVLLDIISNSVDFQKMSYPALQEAGRKFGMEVKLLEKEFHTWEELEKFLKEPGSLSFFNGVTIEGWVLEDSNGYLFKLKTEFYLFWKKMRGLKEKLQKENGKDLSRYLPESKEENMVYNFMKGLPDLESKSIIEVREKYFSFLRKEMENEN